jgi:uncharacterized repeat protein (TIGR01451 family)
VPSSAAVGDFTLIDVPQGADTLIFDEGADSNGTKYDIFTHSSKRVQVNVNAAFVTGVIIAPVYHWEEIAGYPANWGTAPYGTWESQWLSSQIGFLMFRVGATPERMEIYRTLNGGMSWSMIGTWKFDQTAWDNQAAYPDGSLRFHFSDLDHGVVFAASRCAPCGACGDRFFSTSNGGQSWAEAPLPLTSMNGYDIDVSIAHIDSNKMITAGTVGCYAQGYSLGHYYAIWESSDAGATWSVQWSSSASYPRVRSLSANTAGDALAWLGWPELGTPITGYALRSAGTWTLKDAQGLSSVGYETPFFGEQVWLTNGNSYSTQPAGLYRSDGAGGTWNKISDGLPQTYGCGSSQKCLTAAGPAAYGSYDGGVTWRYQAPGGAIEGFHRMTVFDRASAIWKEGGISDPNGRSQLFSYVESWDPNFEVITRATFTNSDIPRGTTTVPMASYQLMSNGPVQLNNLSLTLHASGTGNDLTDILQVKLWWDKNGNETVDAGDELLDSKMFGANNGVVTLSTGSAHTLEQFIPVDILITYDLSAGIRNLKTFRFSLDAADMKALTADTSSPVGASNPSAMAFASRTVTVPAHADMSVDVSDTPDPATAGGTVTYTITVTNNGQDDAGGVTLTDTLPSGTAFVSPTVVTGTCTLGGATVTCSLGNLMNGASAMVAIVVRPSAAGSITNAVAVNAVEIDGNNANNNTSVSTTVQSPPSSGGGGGGWRLHHRHGRLRKRHGK